MWLWIPLLAVYAASALYGCDLRTKPGGSASRVGRNRVAGLLPRPPSWVFGVVWPILLLGLGLCVPKKVEWALVAFLAAWTPLKCAGYDAAARGVLTGSLVLAWMVAQTCRPVWLMVAWLIFASLL